MSNSKRKELKKKLRKQQAEERKRGGIPADNYDDDDEDIGAHACSYNGLDDADVIIVNDMGCLSI